MPELVSGVSQKLVLSTPEVGALNRVKWASSIVNPDGDETSQFGLSKISSPTSEGYEYIRLDQNRAPEKVFIPKGDLVGGPGPEDRYHRLIFGNLRNREPLVVYLAAPKDIVDPINPECINEIGDFVVEVDRTFVQDYASRRVLESQRMTVEMQTSYVSGGIFDADDGLTKLTVEQAAVHLELLERSRRSLAERVRQLPSRALQLGIIFIDEQRFTRGGLRMDPVAIKAIYTSDTDYLTNVEFDEYTRRVVHDLPAVDI